MFSCLCLSLRFFHLLLLSPLFIPPSCPHKQGPPRARLPYDNCLAARKDAEHQSPPLTATTHVNLHTPPLPSAIHCTRARKRVIGYEGGIQRENVREAGRVAEQSPLDICSIRCCAQQRGSSKKQEKDSHPWKLCVVSRSAKGLRAI